MKSNTLIWFSFLCLTEQACVQPYELKDIHYENTLIVEGHITNTLKSQQIRLSRSSTLNQKTFLSEQGADVSIASSTGEKFQFSETNPGIYESIPFAGVVGNSYTLMIKTSNGNEYKSQQVVFKATPAIGKIYAEFVTTPERGIKISIDTNDPLNKTHYYRWNYIETYEIQVPFPSNYVVLPGATEASWRYDRVDQCWASDTLRNVLIKNTRTQDEDKVVAFPLRFIPEDSYIFRVKYSMLVQQYAMSQQSFKYWENIRLFNETQGTLADIQPGAINSNIISLTNPAETVLGYFEASEISEQRVFFDYRDFKDAGYKRPTYKSSCENIIPIYVKEGDIAEYMLTHSEDLTIWDVIGSSPTADFELFPKACCDCSDMGATVKPSFWK